MVEHTDPEHTADQAEAIAFLDQPESYGAGIAKVERIETHGALVFLAGADVYKIKRAVRFPYMDFSTLDKRCSALTRELEINRPQARELYLGLVAITRGTDGALRLGEDGEDGRKVVEWALHMRRFPATDLLSRVVDTRGIDAALARDLADAVVTSHLAAPLADTPPSPADQMSRLIAQVVDGLAAAGWSAPSPRGDEAGAEELPAAAVLQSPPPHLSSARGKGEPALHRLRQSCEQRLAFALPVLERRAAAGFVRRCHGDLHLDNIVLWKGKPTLFDALEFDEALATVDTLYDLAFLLMDLERHGRRTAANGVLNRYLWRTQAMLDIEGLAALPLFMALRAGIRAMVRAQRAAQASEVAGSPRWVEVADYLALALRFLSPPPPCLVAIGGVSGTGKSTLAASLAPKIGALPGALHLRSDLERKAMLGKGETDRLPADSYTAEMSDRVYDQLLAKARAALVAGHSVILDAAHLKPEEKIRAAALASDLSLPFQGFWLTAPAGLLRSRVMGRTGDASDATVEVLEQQLSWAPGAGDWSQIDASGSAADALTEALALHPPVH